MDDIDKALLQAMYTSSVTADVSHQERLDALVDLGLAKRIERKPQFPGYPTPPPVYVLTDQGRAVVEAMEAGKESGGDS